MKEMNLNFFGLKAKIVLPLLLFFGLFMFGANSVAAQSYKSQSQAQTIVKNELFIVQNLGGNDVQVNNNTTLVAKFQYLNYLNQALISPNVEVAVNETYQKMIIKYPSGQMRLAMDLVHQDMVQKLKNN